MGKKGLASGEGKKKKKKEQAPQDEEENEQQEEQKPTLEDLEKDIALLREKGREDPENVDFVQELRKIQDQMADIMGKDKRPMTAKPGEEEESEEEEEEEEEDPDKEVKDLINKRLTSCMLLALSFESEDSYPEDFYEKLKESAKLDEVTEPITNEERKILNNLLKEKKPEAKKRVKRAGKNKDTAKSPKK